MDSSSLLVLSRLLSRLEHTLLYNSAESRLRHSKYERSRVAVNLEHAKTLLLTLDKQSAGIRVQSQQTQAHIELGKKRDAIKRLSARLADLEQLGQAEPDSSDESTDGVTDVTSDAEENTMREFAPARNANAGIDIGGKEPAPTPPQQPQQLRSRKPVSGEDNRAAASTTARETLSAGRKQHPDLETTEAIMSHNREEQEALSNGLLGLAKALKDSSLSFAQSLQAEKEIMSHTEGSLDKSAQGMDQAERKMGMLRRMSEGQGWWGRMKLYAIIAGLWLACLILVFILPKLRF